MKRDPRVYLDDMLSSLAKIDLYIKGVPEDRFCRDSQLQDAVIRRLEIVGEAAKNIPPEIRNRYPDVPWRKITSPRDVVAHAYFGVSLKRI